MKRNREQDKIEPSGLGRLVHKLIMFLTFPFRKLYILIPLLFLAYLIPTFIGAKPAEVHLWYKQKFMEMFSKAKEKVEQKIPETVKDLGRQTIQTIIPEGFDNSQKIQEEPIWNEADTLHRQAFERADGAPLPLDNVQAPQNVVLATQKEEIINKPDPVAVEEPKISSETLKKDKENKLGLIYLVTPQEFSGKAKVTNANEIVINENTIFLYGIYVDPNTTKGIEGKEYLRNWINGKEIRCVVEAYTKQGYATGMCYDGSLSINHQMVNKGFSKNVALER